MSAAIQVGDGLSENARKVLERRYLRKDENGKCVETPEGLFRRVAGFVASADKLYGYSAKEVRQAEDDFYSVMHNLEFIPNSPTLMNAGREPGQLSACFVLPIEDSMDSIFDAIKYTALIHKSGGGTGFSFSRLRPNNSMVRSTGGIASGPVSFLKVFDVATQAVKQGGTRRGANMGILRIDHPDILEFVTCKEGESQINNFNLSVAVTDNFMEKLSRGEEYELVDPHTHRVAGKLSAPQIFDLIVQMAWRNGEPGIIFIDRMNQCNPTPRLGQIESTNPCGEQPLLPYESCNLGSINLLRMVKADGEVFKIDWDKLSKVVQIAVHFLDNVIDLNKLPLDEIRIRTLLTRKIGLGVMGWGSLLAKLHIPYDTDEAVELGGRLMSFIVTEARNISCKLASQRGTFPAWPESVYASNGALRLRNATLTTMAPTGTISIIAGPCSSGIEPIFAISYYREVMDNEKLVEVDPVFEEVAKKMGFYSPELMERIAKVGSVQQEEEVAEDVRRVFRTAHDIDFNWHLKMQAAFQKYTDNAVSKTINFPHQANPDDVRKAYLLAYKLGCKGVTIYRDKSRQQQVLNIASKEPQIGTSERISPRARPQLVHGTTTKVTTGCGNLYVTINVDDKGLPFELFAQMGKAGGCASSQLEAIARLVSLALRSGIDFGSIIGQLRGIRCPSPTWQKGGRIFSCADATAHVIERHLRPTRGGMSEEVNPVTNIKESVLESEISHGVNSIGEESGSSGRSNYGNVVGVCPDCGEALRHQEGCMVCVVCGYSKC